MELLKERILLDGIKIGTEIVKVDSFLNHQIDTKLLEQIAVEFKRRFQHLQVDKILTIEASGIAIACITSLCFSNAPVIFARKVASATMTDAYYGAQVRSFTKKTCSVVKVSKRFINKGDRILIIDDFLAHGEAALGLCEIVEQAGASVAGIGIVIEKRFQGGGARIREKGYLLHSLAVIEKITDGEIIFA